MQVVELSREIPPATLARFTGWLRRLTEPSSLARLSRRHLSMVRGSGPKLRWRRVGGALTPVKDLAREEYLRRLPHKRMAAGVLLRYADEIVLVEPTYKDAWEIPGGVVEADESPWVAAERELKEELGLVRENMPVLLVDYVPRTPDGVPEGLLWIFDGGSLSESEREHLGSADENEVRSVRLLSIDEARQRTSGSLALRLRVAFDAALTSQAARSAQATLPAHVTVFCDRGEPRPVEQPVPEPVVSSTRGLATV
jgi:8-oxo-dGTP pyrophosphatase MutT (NUDIX family)